MPASEASVIVTGCRGQLGRAITAALHADDIDVVGIDVAPPDGVERNDGVISYWAVDIRDKEQVDEFYANLSQNESLAPVGLVNNAGVAVFSSGEERTQQEVDLVLGVNVSGALWMTMGFAKFRRELGLKGGGIVNIASLYGMVSPDPDIYVDLPRKSSEIYGASKAALLQMTRHWAVHLAADEIRVNAVSPGGILNPTHPQGDGFQKEYSARCPMGRLANAAEIAEPVRFLLSDAASYINGHNLVVDGGFSVW